MPNPVVMLNAESDAMAQHMLAYHYAARAVCEDSPCPAGEVDPSGKLSTAIQSNAFLANVETYTDGTVIVTVLDSVPSKLSATRISHSIMKEAGRYSGVGQYNATTGAIETLVDTKVGSLTVKSYPVPDTIGGYALADGEVAIAESAP